MAAPRRRVWRLVVLATLLASVVSVSQVNGAVFTGAALLKVGVAVIGPLASKWWHDKSLECKRDDALSLRKTLAPQLRAAVRGQKQAVEVVNRAMQRHFTDSGERKAGDSKPMFFLSFGTTAVGKTHFVYTLARSYFKTSWYRRWWQRDRATQAPDGLVHIECASYNDANPENAMKDAIERIIEGRRTCASCIILVDDIERAPPNFLAMFVSAIKGAGELKLVTNRGTSHTVSLAGSMVFLVSNYAQSLICRLMLDYDDRDDVTRAEYDAMVKRVREDGEVKQLLRRLTGADDLLSHIHNVLLFLPFEPLQIREVIAFHVQELGREGVAQGDWSALTVNDEALDALMYHPSISFESISAAGSPDRKKTIATYAAHSALMVFELLNDCVRDRGLLSAPSDSAESAAAASAANGKPGALMIPAVQLSFRSDPDTYTLSVCHGGARCRVEWEGPDLASCSQ